MEVDDSIAILLTVLLVTVVQGMEEVVRFVRTGTAATKHVRSILTHRTQVADSFLLKSSHVCLYKTAQPLHDEVM